MVGHTWMIRGWWGRVMKNRRSRCDWRLITSFYGPFLESPRFLVLIWLMRKTLTLTGLSLSPSLSLSTSFIFSDTPTDAYGRPYTYPDMHMQVVKPCLTLIPRALQTHPPNGPNLSKMIQKSLYRFKSYTQSQAWRGWIIWGMKMR